MIYVVEMQNPDTGEWEVLEGTNASIKRDDALEEMKQDQKDNPQSKFRVVQYVRTGHFPENPHIPSEYAERLENK